MEQHSSSSWPYCVTNLIGLFVCEKSAKKEETH